MRKEVKSSQEIVDEAMRELRSAVEKFARTITQSTSNPAAFLTMDQLEDTMADLDTQTRRTYLKMISMYLSNIDEKEIIASKKGSTKKGE